MPKKLTREEIRRILGPFSKMGSAKSISELDLERNLNLAKGRLARLKEKMKR
jgi:hypothetical protein